MSTRRLAYPKASVFKTQAAWQRAERLFHAERWAFTVFYQSQRVEEWSTLGKTQHTSLSPSRPITVEEGAGQIQHWPTATFCLSTDNNNKHHLKQKPEQKFYMVSKFLYWNNTEANYLVNEILILYQAKLLNWKNKQTNCPSPLKCSQLGIFSRAPIAFSAG